MLILSPPPLFFASLHCTLCFSSRENSYTKSIDPNSVILLDIATKCGFIGDAGKQDITVNYDLTLALQIAGITISPTFRSKTSFACRCFSLSALSSSGASRQAG